MSRCISYSKMRGFSSNRHVRELRGVPYPILAGSWLSFEQRPKTPMTFHDTI